MSYCAGDLWDDDAVLLQPGTPPIIGRAAFHDFMKQVLAKSPSVKVVKCLTFATSRLRATSHTSGDTFEATQKSSDQEAPERLRAKLLRVMKRQPDGSWKFTRVIWLPD